MDYLKDLTDTQLREVAGALESRVRDSKKKATQALSKNRDLLSSWIGTISTRRTTETDEGAAEAVQRAREEKQRAFEKALAENPDAYVLYHMAEYLRGLSDAIRKERNERANVAPKVSGSRT